ncbi:MAG: NTP transferase domain-containing protein, partial [Rhodoblastus sp.]
MGRIDKAFLMLAGRPLIAHAIARLGPQCGMLALNANGEAARFASFGLPVLSDSVADGGPLAGVLAGLVFSRENGFEFLCTVSVDAPFAPDDLCARLHAGRRAADAKIVVAGSGGRRHHAIALWSVDLCEDLRKAVVEEGLREVGAYGARHCA